MEHQQLQHSHQTTTSPALNAGGFINILLIPLLSLLLLGFLKVATLSLGVKNLTRSQTLCIQKNFAGQKELKQLLVQLLKLNSLSQKWHYKKQALKLTLSVALSTGLVKVASLIRKQVAHIERQQKALILQQKKLLLQSELIKKKTLQALKLALSSPELKNIKEETTSKKALALYKKTLSPLAHLYLPEPFFEKAQKLTFSWSIQPFRPLHQFLFDFLNSKNIFIMKQACSSTIKKTQHSWKVKLASLEFK